MVGFGHVRFDAEGLVFSVFGSPVVAVCERRREGLLAISCSTWTEFFGKGQFFD